MIFYSGKDKGSKGSTIYIFTDSDNLFIDDPVLILSDRGLKMTQSSEPPLISIFYS